MFDLKPGFNGLGKGNCKTRREIFKFWNLVRLFYTTDTMSSDNLVTQGFIHGIKGMMLHTRIVRRSGGSEMTSILPFSFLVNQIHVVSSVVESMMNVLLKSSLFCVQYCVILDRIVPKVVVPPNWRKYVSLGASSASSTCWTWPFCSRPVCFIVIFCEHFVLIFKIRCGNSLDKSSFNEGHYVALIWNVYLM